MSVCLSVCLFHKLHCHASIGAFIHTNDQRDYLIDPLYLTVFESYFNFIEINTFMTAFLMMHKILRSTFWNLGNKTTSASSKPVNISQVRTFFLPFLPTHLQRLFAPRKKHLNIAYGSEGNGKIIHFPFLSIYVHFKNLRNIITDVKALGTTLLYFCELYKKNLCQIWN